MICDWWFKVNCAASPGHYAESSEILSRAQHRYKSNSHPVNRDSLTATANPFIIKVEQSQQQRHKSIDPFDFQSDGSNESYEDNISAPLRPVSSGRNAPRRSKAYSRDTTKHASKETQDTAASSSFVGSDNDFNGYHYREPDQNKFTLQSEKKTTTANTSPSTATTTALPTTTSATTIRTTTTPAPTTTSTTRAVENIEQEDVFSGYQYLPPERTSRRLETTRSPSPTTASSVDAQRFTTQQPSSFAPRQPTTSRNSIRQQSFDRTTTEATPAPTTKSTTIAPPLIHNTNSAQLLSRIRVDTSRTTTPFYTPTIPTIISSRYTATEKSTFASTESLPSPSPLSVSEHAMEMMKTLQELKLDTTIPPTAAADGEYERLRPGLVIPPSSGPDALNALAIFYATANDNLASNKSESTKLPGLEDLDVQIGNVSRVSSAHVSNSTVESYENLFGIDSNGDMRKEVSEINSNLQTAPGSDNDLETDFSSNPLLAAAGTPQIRELAQVFTHALSAYLHDPQTFRRVLSEIRPTEPSGKKTTDFLIANRVGRTDEFNMGTGPTYLPTAATSSVTATTNPTPTTEDLEVLEFSDVTSSTNGKETTPTTTDQTTTNSYGSETTTNPPATTKASLSTAHTQILKKSLDHGDRVPASRILTQALENKANDRYTNSILDATTESSNPLAMEINGGLVITTNYPYLQEDEHNNTGYFPLRDRSGSDDGPNTLHQPYGHGVKPANSTPIFDPYPSTESSDEVTASTTESSAPLSFDLLPPAAINKGFTLPLNDILPPVDENDLQRAQSQSIYGNGNDIPIRGGKTAKLIDATHQKHPEPTTSRPGHFITQTFPPSTDAPEKLTRTTVPDMGKITSPWSTLAYTVFLDPLTINDGLMEANDGDGNVTPSPNTYLPRSTTQTPFYAEVSQSTTESLRALAEAGRQGKAASSTPNPTSSDYMEVMQQKANEMFGGLNETSVDHLMNVMKKADKSKTVRRLILLLIQTCDDDYNTTVEQSRTALLNALIGMDGKVDEENELQIIKTQRNSNSNRSAKNIAAPGALNSIADQAPTISSTAIPITTYHRPIIDVLNRGGASTSPVSTTPQYVPSTVATTTAATTEFDDNSYRSTISDLSEFDTTTNYPTVTEIATTQPPVTTTPPPATTTTQRPIASRSSRRTQLPTDSRRVSKDLDRYLGQAGAGSLQVDAAHKHSDTRALELLRSLYSLAGRFGK